MKKGMVINVKMSRIVPVGRKEKEAESNNIACNEIKGLAIWQLLLSRMGYH